MIYASKITITGSKLYFYASSLIHCKRTISAKCEQYAPLYYTGVGHCSALTFTRMDCIIQRIFHFHKYV